MDLQNRNGSRKHLKHFDVTNYEVDSSNRGRYPSTCSRECSQELFVIDVDKLSQIRNGKRDAPQPEGSISSTDQSEGHAPAESTFSGPSATYSSDTLMMSQPKGYHDPNRIPASIFGTRPSNPGEWSVASNESLFSLHIANGSFSRENFLMLYKSGELGRLDEPIKPVKLDDQAKQPRTDAEESSHFQPSLPPVTEAENVDKMPEDMEKDSNVTEAIADATKLETEDHSQEKALPVRITSLSGDCVSSTKSFAFPVFERDEVTNKSINMKITKPESEKQQKATNESQEQPPDQEPESEKEQLQYQPKTPKTSPDAGGSSWFSCFPCFSLRYGR